MVNEDGGSCSFPEFATPTSVAAVLVPYGLGTEQGSRKHMCIHQCLCLDWLPGNRHCKIAAGFSNGVPTYMYMYIHVYVWREGRKEGEREGGRSRGIHWEKGGKEL